MPSLILRGYYHHDMATARWEHWVQEADLCLTRDGARR